MNIFRTDKILEAVDKLDILQGKIYEMQEEVEEILVGGPYRNEGKHLASVSGVVEVVQLLQCIESISESFVKMTEAFVLLEKLSAET